MLLQASNIREAVTAVSRTVDESTAALASISKAIRASAFGNMPGVVDAGGGGGGSSSSAAAVKPAVLLRTMLGAGGGGAGGMLPPRPTLGGASSSSSGAAAPSSLSSLLPPPAPPGGLPPAAAYLPPSPAVTGPASTLTSLGSGGRGRPSVPDATPNIVKKIKGGRG
jgi:hypothetical protein